jgi:hypothetical protein
MEFLHNLWVSNSRLIATLLALAVIAGVSFYLFYHEHKLRLRINELLPERRLPYLIKQWHRRNYAIVLSLMAISVLILFLIPRSLHNSIPEVADAITQEKVDQINSLLPPTDPSAVLDLFERGEQQPSEVTLDALKSRNENALVGAYILHNCDRADEEEVAILLRVLRTDIIKFQADKSNPPMDSKQLYDNIVSAAQGSYEIVYSRAECDSEKVDLLEEQFKTYIGHFRD